MSERRREAARGYAGDLREPLTLLSHALRRKGEAVPPDWAEDSEVSLRAGHMEARLSTLDGKVTAMLINTVRGHRCFSHLFLATSGSAAEDGEPLVRELVSSPPPGIRRFDVTFSAVDRDTEVRLQALFPTWGLPFRSFERERMVLRLDSSSPPEQPPLPPGLRFVHASRFPAGILASVDFRAFEASPDRGLVAENITEDERILSELVGGSLGVFVPDGSPGVIRETGGGEELIGFVLSVELAPGRALIADVALLPEFRGQRVSIALLHRALRGLLARGIREVTLWVTTANLPARALYSRAGFVSTLHEPIYIWEVSPGVDSSR